MDEITSVVPVNNFEFTLYVSVKPHEKKLFTFCVSATVKSCKCYIYIYTWLYMTMKNSISIKQIHLYHLTWQC
jgi:hypothetical protein